MPVQLNRLVAVALLASAGMSARALAQAPASPTQDQLAAAKKAFQEGNALFKAGKLDEAIVKMKESYRLSGNAYLLYNIGHTYDLLNQPAMVLFYYRKFLAAAPADAPMRDAVQKRVVALEAENPTVVTPEGETAEIDAVQPQAPVATFDAKDFKHEQVDTAPPGWPIDITAVVPADSGFTVKLFYRASGDASFVVKPMTWRNYELVARIPGAKATGALVQYYIEVRDRSDKLVTRSGKATSPNLITIETTAKKRYYEDYIDEGGEVIAPVPVPGAVTDTPSEGSSVNVVRAAKWGTSGGAIALLGTSLISYKLAGDQHDKLVADTSECGRPPCRAWDEPFGERVQTLGKRYDTLYKVTLGLGVATAGVATYLWIRDLKRAKAPDATTAWMVAPVVGDDFAGATAAAEF